MSSGTSMTTASSAAPKQWVSHPKWLLLGDSITEMSTMPGGLHQRLAVDYTRTFDIINRGYAGYNTEWAKRIAPKIFPSRDDPEPLTVLSIWFGANDSVAAGRPQHVGIDAYRENMHALIDLLQNPSSANYSPSTAIIVIAPPPVDVVPRPDENHEEWVAGALIDRNVERTRDYARVAGEVAKERKVGFVDAWTLMTNAAGSQAGLRKLLSDGLHLHPAGYKIVVDGIMRVLSTDFPDLHPSKVKRLFPDWDAIDPENPDAMLR